MEVSLFQKYFDQKRGEVRKQRKAIKEILEAGPKTISAIADTTEFDTQLILWNLLAMMRWKEVVVSGHEDDELIYKLSEASEE
jgi:predicted transcriptional regulator